LSFITIFTLCMWFPHIATDFVLVLDMVNYSLVQYNLAIHSNGVSLQIFISVCLYVSCFFLKNLANKTGNVCTDITLRGVRVERKLVLYIMSVPLWPQSSSMQCLWDTLYCPLWPVCLYHIFPNFRKDLWNIKCIFWISVKICLK
jgi:hypothetical protein